MTFADELGVLAEDCHAILGSATVTVTTPPANAGAISNYNTGARASQAVVSDAGVPAIAQPRRREMVGEGQTQRHVWRTTISVLASALSTDPNHRTTVTLNGVAWKVTGEPQRTIDRRSWTMRLERER